MALKALRPVLKISKNQLLKVLLLSIEKRYLKTLMQADANRKILLTIKNLRTIVRKII